MSDYASTFVSAKLQAVTANINARMQEISSQTGISFGAFLAESMETKTASSSNAVNGLAYSTLLSQNTTDDNDLISQLQNTGMSKAVLDALNALKAQVPQTKPTTDAQTETDTIPAESVGTEATGAAEGQGSSAKDTAVNLAGADGKYTDLIETVSAKYGISPLLVQAIVFAESNFNTEAVSGAGAMGLMQLMPATVSSYGVEDAFDPEQNLEGGIRCLLSHLTRFDGDVKLALAAYNCGVGGVTSRNITDLNDPLQMNLLPGETQGYLANIERYLADIGAEGLLSENLYG